MESFQINYTYVPYLSPEAEDQADRLASTYWRLTWMWMLLQAQGSSVEHYMPLRRRAFWVLHDLDFFLRTQGAAVQLDVDRYSLVVFPLPRF